MESKVLCGETCQNFFFKVQLSCSIPIKFSPKATNTKLNYCSWINKTSASAHLFVSSLCFCSNFIHIGHLLYLIV